MSQHSRVRALSSGIYRNSAVRYLVIGGFSFVIDFGLLFLLHEVADWPIWLATAVAFLASFAFNYSLQKAFSFSSRAHHGRALAKYVALVVINTVATTAIVSLLDRFENGWEIGKILATILTTAWNYFAYRYWVFSDGAHDGQRRRADVHVAQVVEVPRRPIEDREAR